MLASTFLTKLHKEVPHFMSSVVAILEQELGIQVSSMQADHVCWRTETQEEYSDLVAALLHDIDKTFSLLIESDIGGRPIATFQIAKERSIQCESSGHAISVIEIPSPKHNSPYESGLEHVEFVIPGSNDKNSLSPWNDARHQAAFDDLIKRHPRVGWNEKARHKEINPDISVKLHLEKTIKYCSVKFHSMPLADVIAAEKQLRESGR